MMKSFDYVVEIKNDEGWIKIALFKFFHDALFYVNDQNNSGDKLNYRLIVKDFSR